MDEDPNLLLPPEFTHTPLRALRITARKKLAQFLNLDGNLLVIEVDGVEMDIVNNYNGLAELVQFDYLQIQNMTRCASPTEELLNQWTNANSGGPTVPPTVGNLWGFLFLMERYDVLTDCRRSICNDCRVFEEHRQLEQECQNYHIEQDPTVSNSDMKVDEFKVPDVTTATTGESIRYNAFMCYTFEDPEDLKFVRYLISELEVKRGLKLFVPGRDDLPGSAYHTITAYLIEKKCDRVVVILSQSFLKSQACDFQLKFAQSLAPGARSKKLIPVLRDRNAPTPRILKFLAMCDFSKVDMRDWVLDRLYAAIIAPIGPEIYSGTSELDEHYSTSARGEFYHMTYPKTLRSPFCSAQACGSSSSPESDLMYLKSNASTMSCSQSPGSSSMSSMPGDQPLSESPDAGRNESDLDSDSFASQASDESQFRTATSSSMTRETLSSSTGSQSSISKFFPRTDEKRGPNKPTKSQTEVLTTATEVKSCKNDMVKKLSFPERLMQKFSGGRSKKSKESKEGKKYSQSEVLGRQSSAAVTTVRNYNSSIVSGDALPMKSFDNKQELFDCSVTSSSEFVKVELKSVDGFDCLPSMEEYVSAQNTGRIARTDQKQGPTPTQKPSPEQRRSRSPCDNSAPDQTDKTVHFV